MMRTAVRLILVIAALLVSTASGEYRQIDLTIFGMD